MIICIVGSVNILGMRKWKMIIVSFWSLRSSEFKQGRRSGNSSYIAIFCISHWPLSHNAGKQNSVLLLFWVSSLSVTLICLAFALCPAAPVCSLACFSSSYPSPFHLPPTFLSFLPSLVFFLCLLQHLFIPPTSLPLPFLHPYVQKK